MNNQYYNNHYDQFDEPEMDSNGDFYYPDGNKPNNQAKPQNPFEEYEWMVDMDKFDQEHLKQIAEDDELEELFYWDPENGCNGTPSGKNEVKQKKLTHKTSSSRNSTTNTPTAHTTNHSQVHGHIPNLPVAQPVQEQNSAKPSYTFNPLSDSTYQTNFNSNGRSAPMRTGLPNGRAAPQKASSTHDELLSSFDNINLDRFNFNPNAKEFVPSWLNR